MFKKLLPLISILLMTILIATGCTSCDFNSSTVLDSGNMNEMDYFNKYIDEVNKNSQQFSTLQDDYEANVPLDVVESDEILFTGVYAAEAETQLNNSKSNLLDAGLKIDDQNKQTELEKLYREYVDLYTKYLTTYNTIALYYSSQDYKQNIALAATYEETLQDNYASLYEKQEEIYSLLKQYQGESDYKANIESDNPLERLNASIDAMTDDAEEIYQSYMVDWDAASPPTEVELKYTTIKLERDKLVNSINELDYLDVSLNQVKNYYDNSYLVHYDSLLTNIKKLIDDYKAGLVSETNIATYDTNIQNDYENVILSHNEIITLTEQALNVNY